MKSKVLNQIIQSLFIVICFCLAIPSIIYLINHKTVLNLGPYFYFLYDAPIERIHQTLMYIAILIIISILYFIIIKRRKEIFSNIKEIFIFIAIIAIIFALILPFTSSDIFYYMGIGRLDAKYHQNPYYITVHDFVDTENNTNYLDQDTTLKAGYENYWSDTTVVYGPVWTIICKIVGALSLGNVDFGLVIFKIINILVHILNCYLIYKISRRKLFCLIYGLNPLVLLEGISCVHNDIYVVLFILLSLYFLRTKKNLILSVIALAMATAIKYFAIILLPFIIIYYFRDEKPLKRLLKCVEYGLIFFIALAMPYLLYIQDLQVFSGLLVQQGKIAKSFYLIIYEYINETIISTSQVNHILLATFTIIYFFTCVVLLNKKEIKFREEMRKANYFIMAFLFLLITNFQPWYVMWILPLIMWQKAEKILWIMQITIMCQLANSLFLAYGEDWRIGIPFTFVFIGGSFVALILDKKIRQKKKRKKLFF